MFTCVSFFSCDDSVDWSISCRNLMRAHADGPDRGWCVSSTVDEGSTQAWDTVGAGKTNPRVRELI